MCRRYVSGRVVYVVSFLLTVTLALNAQDESGAWHGGHISPSAHAKPLHALVLSGRLDDLRWPDFSDHRGDVENFYSRSGYSPAWLQDGRPTTQALQMIDILQQADADGLRADDYDASRWLERLALLQRRHSLSDEVRFDVALTVCAMRYVSDLRVGRINPRYFKFDLDVGPNELDLPMFVHQRLADGKDLKSALAGIEPPFVGYRNLRKALSTYMRLAIEDDGEKVPMPEDIGYPGLPYAGFDRLTRLLRRLGDLPDDYSPAAASSLAYDPALVQAVRRFQERHGHPVTGYLDAETVAELNVPLRQRVEQIRLALERYRWVRYDFPQPPIVVNIPGFHLYAFDADGKVALTMRIDVGEDFDNTRTPAMEDYIEYLVFRPYWEVPPQILKNEIIPMISEHPSSLSEYDFEVVARTGQVVTRAKVTPEVLQQLRAGTLRVRQRPGPYNAMGLVKFIFPNRYSVYLHDIPEREFRFLFSERVASHGCIHVEKPAELAAWMLRDQPQWTLERVRQAMHNGQNSLTVKLSKPLPVLIVYTTVAAPEDGGIHFYRDIYGYDAELSQALAGNYPFPKWNHETKVLPER
jgi:murein L,D-transpeptidase YcbB/YkuD